jgi:predicted ester cyclase
MEREAIERLVRRWLDDGIGRGELSIFDELLAEDVCDSSGGTLAHGRESFKRRAQAVHTAFTERVLTLDDLLCDGDRAAWRWSLTGTHSGSFGGIAATGRRITLRGVNLQRFAGGRVVEHWTLADLAGVQAALQA